MTKKRGPKGPSVIIDWVEFEKLCGLHCTQTEIAEWFDCDPDTIQNHCKRHYNENFSDVFKKKSSKGKISLRRKMYELAMKGNVAMCIFLSKNILGFSDKNDSQIDNSKTITLKYSLPIKDDQNEQKRIKDSD